MGLFTTLRVIRGEPLFWGEHLARLYAVGGFDAGKLRAEVADRARGLEDARVRITLQPPEPPQVEARAYAPPKDPWRLSPVKVSHAGDGPLPKTTDRRRYDEAQRAAPEADDALLLSPDGRVLESTVANVFFLLPGGQIVTPPAAGILPGIARARVLRRAIEAPLTLADVSAATACVVTNALFLVHPVASITGVREFDSLGLARDLREVVRPTGLDLRIIQR